MLPCIIETADKKKTKVDLAVLSLDNLQKLPKEAGLSVTSMKHAELIGYLRENGVGELYRPPGANGVSTGGDVIVVELLHQDLVKEMAGMKAEILSLRETMKEKSTPSPCPLAQTTSASLTGMAMSHTWGTSHRDMAVQGVVRTPPLQPEQNSTPASPKPPNTVVTPYYQRPSTKSTSLRGPSRTMQSHYVANVDLGYSADSIEKWCRQKDISILKSSVSETKT